LPTIPDKQAIRLCATAIILSVLTACASSPSVRDYDTVSVQIFSDSDFYLDLEKTGYVDPEMSPGKLAGEGMAQAMRDCAPLWENPIIGIIAAPLCALGGATAGAAVGVAAQGVAGTPEKADATLQTVIDSVNAPDAWRSLFQSSLEAVARQRGKNVVAFPDGETVYVVVEDLYWRPSSGKRLAIRGKFMVAVRSGSDFARRSFTVSSRSYPIDQWLAGGGERVSDELESFLEQVGHQVWEIVDR
jgi:hypothetical protein